MTEKFSITVNYEELAKIFSILANPIRLQILDVLIKHCNLSKEGCCVNDINKQIELPQPYVSKHLKIFKEHGILIFTRKGNKINYSFNKTQVFSQLMAFLAQYKNCCKE